MNIIRHPSDMQKWALAQQRANKRIGFEMFGASYPGRAVSPKPPNEIGGAFSERALPGARRK